MRNLDFSSLPALFSGLVGLAVITLIGVGIRLLFMQTVERVTIDLCELLNSEQASNNIRAHVFQQPIMVTIDTPTSSVHCSRFTSVAGLSVT